MTFNLFEAWAVGIVRYATLRRVYAIQTRYYTDISLFSNVPTENLLAYSQYAIQKHSVLFHYTKKNNISI